MQSFPSTIIIRHRKENLKKCTLRGLEGRKDFSFYSYPYPKLSYITGYVLLALDAPILDIDNDKCCGLLILDGTWRYAGRMKQQIPELQDIPRRSLPKQFTTAYPRCQHDCPDPSSGLASIEAIYLAYHILGRDTSGILDNYHWKSIFLEKNDL